MKKSVSIILAVVLAIALAVSVYAASGDTTVYRTSSGTKYHTENCSSLKGNGIAITLQEAVDKGLEPCSKCNPPTLDAESATAEESSSASSATTEAAATAVTAAAVAGAEKAAAHSISPVLTFFIGLLAGAIAMVIVYRKLGPSVLAAAAAEAEAEEEAEEPEE